MRSGRLCGERSAAAMMTFILSVTAVVTLVVAQFSENGFFKALWRLCGAEKGAVTVNYRNSSQNLVPRAGLEPAQEFPLPPQDSVSTSSTTSAQGEFYTKPGQVASLFFSPGKKFHEGRGSDSWQQGWRAVLVFLRHVVVQIKLHGTEACATTDAEFSVDPAQMDAQGCFGDIEAGADFQILHATLYKAYNFDFTFGEACRPVRQRMIPLTGAGLFQSREGRQRFRFRLLRPEQQGKRMQGRNKQEYGQTKQLKIDGLW